MIQGLLNAFECVKCCYALEVFFRDFHATIFKDAALYPVSRKLGDWTRSGQDMCLTQTDSFF